MAGLEEAAETAEEVVKEIGGVSNAAAGTLVVIGTTAGVGIGYYIAQRRLEKKYEKISENEIDAMREHFRKRSIAREDKPDLGDLVKKTEELGYSEPPPPGEPNIQAPEAKSVFTDVPPRFSEWDYEIEKPLREGKSIYVIHVDEFDELDEHQSMTLTYYTGDDVLCHELENNRIVDDQERLIGTDSLDKFGHGSGDRNVVYVRNEELQIDVEIIKTDKNYAEEVHGFKHEDRHRRRRERLDE